MKNYVPSDDESSSIKAVLRRAEDELAILRFKMSSLQTKLHNKTKERDACQRVILQYHHLLSPLGLFPNDILAIIFGYCLPDSRCATFNTNEPPILLSLVCRRWRLVAYHSPQLWAFLHIQFPSYTDSPDSEYIRPHFQAQVMHHQAAISQWLSRSGSFPLSISLYPPVNSYSAAIEYYQGYLDILLSVTHRIRAMEEIIPAGDFSSFFASFSVGDFPMLDTLHLTFNQSYRLGSATHDKKWQISGLLCARNLRSLYISDFPCSFPHLVNGWSTLTHLDIISTDRYWKDEGLSIANLSTLFLQCGSLVHCGVEVHDTPSAVCSLGRIHLPYLRSITIMDGAPQLSTSMDILDLPNLRIVKYETKFLPSEFRIPALLALLARNYGATESLMTNVEFMTSTELLRCFSLTPFLTHFRQEHSRIVIQQVDFSRTFLELLFPDEHCQCFWPNLINIDITGVRSLDIQVIIQFFRRRRTALALSGIISPLKQVRVEFGYNTLDRRPMMDPSGYQKLTWDENGVQASVIYPRSGFPIPGKFMRGPTYNDSLDG